MIDASYIRNIHNSNTLLDILVEIEKFLDNNDIYAYKNWFSGEVIEGPLVGKYDVKIALKYDHHKMPDPLGAKRLIERGCKVKYKKAKKQLLTNKKKVENDVKNYMHTGNYVTGKIDPEDDENVQEDLITVWIIVLVIPIEFITYNEFDDTIENNDDYDEDDLKTAKKQGIEDEDSYRAK